MRKVGTLAWTMTVLFVVMCRAGVGKRREGWDGGSVPCRLSRRERGDRLQVPWHTSGVKSPRGADGRALHPMRG